MTDMKDVSPTLKKIREYKIIQLKALLYKCSNKQRDFFDRIYGSVESISDSKIDWAIVQCENTVKLNIKKFEVPNDIS